MSTNQIEDEIEKLNELYRCGFVPHFEYEARLKELNISKKYSTVHIVPHVDHGFTNTRRATTATSKNRNVRIFVSSTFRDMSDERESLTKTVFPKIREMFKEKGIFLTIVDLRWGITEKDTERGDTIGICLTEIDRCRPYFLCMLGYRYGWAQPADPRAPRDALLQKTFATASADFSWIQKYSDRSVTELEIRHAVMNDPQSDTAQKSLFCRKVASGAVDDDERLTNLKSELDINPSIKTKKYKNMKDFEEAVYDHFMNLLNEDFPGKSAPTPLERERMAHDAFEDSRARVYIGRQYYFDTINGHLAKPNSGPMVIIGNSGSGKSALVCNWAVQYRESHPAELVITHYIGSTAASTNLGRMIQRILQEIDQFYELGKAKEIPQEFKELSEAFPKWLAEASRRGGLVLVLDAVNQLDPHHHNPFDLNWLPLIIPSNVKLVISTLPGRAQEVLSSRGWTTLTVQPLTTAERLTLIQEYLALYGKKLTDEQLEIIVEATQCENPLFLRTLLEEIRVYGIFEKLNERIRHYLKAKSPPQLFELVFQRLEGDFETERKGLVGDILASLWVARRGLLEAELIEVLSVQQHLWSPLYLAMSEAVVSKSGYLTFFHDYMRQAVETCYLKRPNAYDKYREILINYFSEKCKESQRKFEEVPYLLEASMKWPALCTFISKLEHFVVLCDKDFKFDLYRYWRTVENNGQNPSSILLESLRKQSAVSKDVISNWSKAAQFFQDIGQYSFAELCSRAALVVAEALALPEKVTAGHIQELAYILRLQGKYTEASPLYEKALKIFEVSNSEPSREYAQIINSLAILYRMQGKYPLAEPLYLRALNMRLDLFGDVHEDVAQSYNSLGCLNQDMGRYPIAEKYLQQAISLREQLMGSNHPDVAMSLNNLGGLYLDWSKYSMAEPAYLRAMQIYKAVFGDTHPNVAKSLNSLAGLYQEQGKYNQAEGMYHKCIAMKRKLLGPKHPELALTLNDFAVLYARQDKYDEAEKLYKEALEIRREVLGEKHPDYSQSVKNMASLYQDRKQYNQALPLFKQSLQIVTEVFGQKHQDVAAACISLAGCHQLLGQYNDAESLYLRALSILQELLGANHADVALALNDAAILYYRKGDMGKCEEYYLKALKTYENVFGLVHPHTGEAVLNVAHFYKNTGKMDKAPKFFKQAIEIFQQVLGSDHPKTQRLVQEFGSLAV